MGMLCEDCENTYMSPPTAALPPPLPPHHSTPSATPTYSYTPHHHQIPTTTPTQCIYVSVFSQQYRNCPYVASVSVASLAVTNQMAYPAILRLRTPTPASRSPVFILPAAESGLAPCR